MTFGERSLIVHEQLRGKIAVTSKLPVATTEDMSIAYTPGVAAPCEAIAADPAKAYELTIKRSSVAVVTDGSAVLGLGNIGPLAAMPVMEGKALLFKEYGNIDAWPICLDTQDSEEIIATVRRIAPGFGGVNLEDISAPRCFEIEDRLQDLGIPVFHDDQHGTAIVLLAAMINACKVTGKKMTDLTVVINGAGAAGTAIAKLLRCVGHENAGCMTVREVIICDSKGAIHAGREDLNEQKKALLQFSNSSQRSGELKEVIKGTDVFVGVSKGNLLDRHDIAAMNPDAIILAMANPTPEILPEEAKAGGAAIVGTGRSDFPNQVNNVLAFPGIFRGALDARAARITPAMKLAAAHALADAVQDLSADKILPSPLNTTVPPLVARAVAQAWSEA
ncbi:NAD(P)-dependent malic enzyme [Roseibacillus ishigakijimensis]|uniref:NADP-dependent malic enzyme n=1 Tax=Roseibacillus ishigakijimensis TaxID=454146 RepID=A0A934RTH5_9BACT|nr:NADP-dependent malic enzyme [Roseibacillus ishigakijimensis]MBK1835346.1 NADP-dependent malic enzyme [Roseibacillus ishigakijimensis]